MSDRRVNWALLFGLAGVFLAYISRVTLANNDMFHAMALFREALAAGWVPQKDLYAFTPTIHPVVHHEWATGAVLYLSTVTSGLGSAGLMILKYLLTGAVAAGCYWCARQRGASVLLFVVLAPLVLPFGWVGFGTVRAQLFTLFFLVCLLLLLEQDRRGRRWWLAAWLPMYVVWLNIHAGFVAGVGLLGLYTIDSFGRAWGESKRLSTALVQTRHLLVTAVVMIPCLCINPFGHDYIDYLWHGLKMHRPLIREWDPLWNTFQPLLTMEVFLISLALVVYAVRQQGLRRLPGLILVLVSAWLALRHIRHGSIYAVVWLCYVPAYVQETELGRWFCQLFDGQRQRGRLVWAGVIAGCLGLSVATTNRFWELTMLTHSEQEPLLYPAGAVDYLAAEGFTGNLIVPFNTGAYVSWKLYPAVKVSFDSRYEAAYPPGALEQNFDLYGGKEGWQQSLTRHQSDAVLARSISPLADLLESTADSLAWQPVYRDDDFVVYARSQIARELRTVDRTGERILATFP